MKALKKPKPTQPQQPEQPKQTLLSILTKKVEEPLAEPPTQSAQMKADEQVKVDESVKVDEPVKEKLITVKPKPVKRILTPQKPTESDLQQPNKSEADSQSPTPQNESEKPEDTTPVTLKNNAIFQAVGEINKVRIEAPVEDLVSWLWLLELMHNKGLITIVQKPTSVLS